MPDFLDTNVLVRFLTGDMPVQAQQAVTWFLEAEKGKRDIAVSSLIVAETCFVLESFYKKSRLEIAEALSVFLSQRFLQVEQREVLLDALDDYKQGRHFVDSYLLALSRNFSGQILTFDKKLKKLSQR